MGFFLTPRLTHAVATVGGLYDEHGEVAAQQGAVHVHLAHDRAKAVGPVERQLAEVGPVVQEVPVEQVPSVHVFRWCSDDSSRSSVFNLYIRKVMSNTTTATTFLRLVGMNKELQVAKQSISVQ